MARILLSGATGLVGGEALRLLLADDRVAVVVAPTRRALAAHAKLVNPVVDADSLPLDAEWWAVDGAIGALGTTRRAAGSAAAFRAIDHDYALAVARRVREGGAKRFALCSSTGANARSPLLYPRTKGELEEAVGGLGFASLTIVRPGFIGGVRSEVRPMERFVGAMLRATAPLLPMAARISPAPTIARFLVEAAIAGGEGVRVVGPAEIARAG